MASRGQKRRLSVPRQEFRSTVRLPRTRHFTILTNVQTLVESTLGGMTMRVLLRLILMLLLPALPLVLVACSGGDDDDDPAPAAEASTNGVDEADGEAEEAPAPTMTGTWSGTFGTGVAFAMNLTQTGDAITGTYSTGALGGNVAGTISGNALTMTVTIPGGATSEWTGAANDARTSMNGSFTIVAGGGGSGTWSATK